MKKRISLLCIFILSVSVFAEINLQLGVATNYTKNKIDNDTYLYSYSGSELQFKPSISYFNTKESKIGFGLNIGMNFLLSQYSFAYKNDLYDTFKETDAVWYGETFQPSENQYTNDSNLSITPTINFRFQLNNKNGLYTSIGPTYTLGFLEYYYAKKEDGYKVQNYTQLRYRNAKIHASERHIISLEGQFGFYHSSDWIFQDISCYFRLGNLEYSELTKNKFIFTPSFSIGIIYRPGYSFDTRYETNLRLESERQKRLEEERREQEYYNKLLEEKQKQLNEQNAKIKEKYGDKDIINLNMYSKFSNPYAFDMNVIYYLEDQLFVHQWISTGFIGGMIPKEALIYDRNNQIYIAYIPEKTNVNTSITNVYLQYIGIEEFTNGLGGTVILPKFMVLQYN